MTLSANSFAQAEAAHNLQNPDMPIVFQRHTTNSVRLATSKKTALFEGVGSDLLDRLAQTMDNLYDLKAK